MTNVGRRCAFQWEGRWYSGTIVEDIWTIDVYYVALPNIPSGVIRRYRDVVLLSEG